jgi:hypothetical protein
MMGRIPLALLTVVCLSSTVAFGQTPEVQPAAAGQVSSNAANEEPGATGSSGRPAAAPASQRGPGPIQSRADARNRRAQSYARCNASARQRSLRGAERRRFVARCELGYERPVTKP